MNVLEALGSRYSVRAFKSDPVSHETLTKILEAANHAPSWGNTQPWVVYVAAGEPLERLRRACTASYQSDAPFKLEHPAPQQWPPAQKKNYDAVMVERMGLLGISREDKDGRKKMGAQNHKFFGAPVVIYLCMDRSLTPWSMFDLGAYSQSIMLAAQEFGVDSMPAVMLVAYSELVRKELGIAPELTLVFGIALGYRDPQNKINVFHSRRRPLTEFVNYKLA